MSSSQSKTPAPDPTLRIRALGRAQLLRASNGEAGEVLLGSGKPLALLTYLNALPDRVEPRERLVDFFWADLLSEGGRAALRQTLWHIRRRLGVDPFNGEADSVRLPIPIASDVRDFEAAVARGAHGDALAMYEGDFLDRFAAPGCDEFEKWSDIERRRLRALFCRSAHEVTRQRLGSGRFREAQEIATRVRDLDRLNEAGWRLLIEVHVASGNVLAASLEGQELQRHFLAEGMDLDPATKELLKVTQSLPSIRSEARDGRVFTTDLVGREDCFSALLAAWDAARGGRLRHVHVTAPAGLGKTRLLHDFGARLRIARSRPVLVRATSGQRDVAYAFVSELVASLASIRGAAALSSQSAAAFVALNPQLSTWFSAPPDSTTGSEGLRRRGLALRELLVILAEEHPVALLIDDLHWCDASSRATLSVALSALESARILVVTAARPTAVWSLGHASPEMLSLSPLSEEGVHRIVSQVAALPPDRWAASFSTDLTLTTDGSPLLVFETLQLLLDHERLTISDGTWHLRDAAGLAQDLRAGAAVFRRVSALDRTAANLLLHLALAGAPLSVAQLAAATGCHEAEISASLGMLEQRGFVLALEDSWQPAHDTIADAAVDRTGPDAQRAAHLGLANMMSRAQADEATLVAAVQHAANAGDDKLAQQLFARVLRSVRARGDRRPNDEIVSEVLGRDNDKRLRAVMVRGLPLAYRAGMYSVRRIAAAAAMLFGVPLVSLSSVLVWRSNPRPPDHVLVVFARDGKGGMDGYRVGVRSREWEGARELNGWWRRPVDYRFQDGFAISSAGQLPSGHWIGHAAIDDSGAIDLFSVAPGGARRRLTYFRGDDGAPSVSPDARLVAFGTSRWSDLSRYDIAVLNLTTNSVRQLTSGPESDGAPLWRSDGSAIAFSRRYWDGRGATICVVSPDGGDVDCLENVHAESINPNAWYDARTLVATRVDSGVSQIVLLDLDRSAVRPIATLPVGAPVSVSPDGQWIACQCTRVGYPPESFFVFPVSQATDRLLIVPEANHPIRTIAWEAPRVATYVDTLRIITMGIPSVQVSHRLQARAVSSTGVSLTADRVRWESLDTSVAIIDSRTGLLLAHRPGSARIVATTGGWRSDTARLEIAPRSEPVAAFDESWNNGFSAWWPFGEPRPQIVSDPTFGFAFLNNGDGSFHSGVVSRSRFPMRRGIALDVDVSAALTLTQWQEVSASLAADLDQEKTDGVDWSSGDLGRGTSQPRCQLQYPTKDAPALDSLSWVLLNVQRSETRAVAPPAGAARGRPMRLRVQLFPDGRCGFAVNGVPIGTTEEGLPGEWARVVLSGNSHKTRMLVGGVSVRLGIPSDIDWSHTTHPAEFRGVIGVMRASQRHGVPVR